MGRPTVHRERAVLAGGPALEAAKQAPGTQGHGLVTRGTHMVPGVLLWHRVGRGCALRIRGQKEPGRSATGFPDPVGTHPVVSTPPS